MTTQLLRSLSQKKKKRALLTFMIETVTARQVLVYSKTRKREFRAFDFVSSVAQSTGSRHRFSRLPFK